MKSNYIKQFVLIIGLLFSLAVFNSCVEDNEVSITEPTRYTNNDVKSYADLFKVFWNVMNTQYNYFYEQKRIDGMDWDKVYQEYYPKFLALKTFGRPTENDKDIKDDLQKAKEYFTEIVNPILDRHFNVDITMPSSNNRNINTVRFSGGMKDKINNYYVFDSKYRYMKDRLAGNVITKTDDSFTYLGGSLKSNSDIYYFTFNRFALTVSSKINLLNKYLSPDEGNAYLLTIADIEQSDELNGIKDVALRNKVKNHTINVLNQWNSFTVSGDVKNFIQQAEMFNKTEEVSDALLKSAQTALTKSKSLVAFSDLATYSSVSTTETLPYIKWFISRMDRHVRLGYRLLQFQQATADVIDKAPLYRQFLNPLRKGEIKKLILDFRNNGGGNVIDSRFFSERFVTKNAVFSYQRVKEGSGRFNYTPWAPARTTPNKFGIPSNIPIVILTDKRSASMSEITTLMLKSQGNHVISVGDYSAGATAGLGYNDDFNGGTRDQVTSFLGFYMPLMAMKDMNGDVIEGIGVKPDIFVTPPTDEEVNAMKNSPSTFTDRVMVEAVKYLSSK